MEQTIEYWRKDSILTSLIMTSKNKNIQHLYIKNCKTLDIAIEIRAQNLKELRDELLTVHSESTHIIIKLS